MLVDINYFLYDQRLSIGNRNRINVNIERISEKLYDVSLQLFHQQDMVMKVI